MGTHSYPVAKRHPNSVLEGFYALHDELGCGGFGKVRLATHLATQQKVAIKIIDKKAIGDDLPRVRTELEALKTLCHQNICRLYHSIETDDKFFIVMEYCAGGEMFDYIVKKERLEESEARHFFRQLVQGMAYIHSQGFAHRDLKPENLLLTEDLHLKVIDFGLCARPGSMNKMLETCCGSPAYAAPELVLGQPYMGNEADVWSMGVLLYALLCGRLPFEDDNVQVLYRRVAKGAYEEPDFLSKGSKEILREMLQTDPSKRITIPNLLIHPWMNRNFTNPIKWKSIYNWEVIDTEVAAEMAFYYKKKPDQMIELIKEWKFDYMTATYFILLRLKTRRQTFAMPPPPRIKGDFPNIITSPTIHASLEHCLDKSGIEEQLAGMSIRDSASDDSNGYSRFVKPLAPLNHKESYANAMMSMDAMIGENGKPEPSSTPRPRIVPRTSAQHSGNKENCNSTEQPRKPRTGQRACRASSLRVRGPATKEKENTSGGTLAAQYRQVYATPQRNSQDTPTSTPRAHSTDRGATGSPVSTGGSYNDGRTPRSTTKSRALRTRVFASLERKADRVFNMLTPKKSKNDSPQILKNTKGLVNVSITSSKEPNRVRNELEKIFEQQGMKYELKGWKISGSKQTGTQKMTVELEVVIVESLGYVGIKRKRLNGDAFLYKRVCEQVLQMAGL
ncbi:unnamed protein product, partial [Mesorhabditis spiculigera]